MISSRNPVTIGVTGAGRKAVERAALLRHSAQAKSWPSSPAPTPCRGGGRKLIIHWRGETLDSALPRMRKSTKA